MMLDISFCRQKLFQSLIDNIPLMFPKDCLETSLKIDDMNLTMFLEIRLTTSERQQQRQDDSFA
jgi:hypothetical protein